MRRMEGPTVGDFVPTPRLRWAPRKPPGPKRVLEQWWAPSMPDFMRGARDTDGQWREVPVAESPP